MILSHAKIVSILDDFWNEYYFYIWIFDHPLEPFIQNSKDLLKWENMKHTYQFPRYNLIHIAEWEYDARHFIRTMRLKLWYYISGSSHDILSINNDYLEARRLLLDCVPTGLGAAHENSDSVP